MSALIIRFAEEKAKRLNLRNVTAIKETQRKFCGLDPHDCGDAMLMAVLYGVNALTAIHAQHRRVTRAVSVGMAQNCYDAA